MVHFDIRKNREVRRYGITEKAIAEDGLALFVAFAPARFAGRLWGLTPGGCVQCGRADKYILTEGKMAVFAGPDKGLVGCRYDSEQIYIKAHSEKALNQLEEYADIFVGEF